MRRSPSSNPESVGAARGVEGILSSTEHVPDDGIFVLMRRALNLATREMDRQLEAKELTSAQLAPLLRLYLDQGSTIGKLARDCEQDAGARTRLLDRLEAKGFCQRERSVEDRRTVRVVLTKRGRDVAKAIPAVLGSVQEAQLADFSFEEIELLKRFLHRIVKSPRHQP